MGLMILQVTGSYWNLPKFREIPSDGSIDIYSALFLNDGPLDLHICGSLHTSGVDCCCTAGGAEGSEVETPVCFPSFARRG
jgi:hypothetical protein